MGFLTRALMAIATIAFTIAPALAVQGPPVVRLAGAADARIGIELGDLSSGSMGPVFVDAMKEAAPWSSTSPLALDIDGNVRALSPGHVAERSVDATRAYPLGDYTLLYSGAGRIEIDGATIVRRTPGREVIRVSGRFAGLRLRLLATDPHDYVRDVRLILPGYESTAARSPFVRTFVASLARANVLRFARWSNPSSSGDADWPARATLAQTQIEPSGVAPEYMIALANQTGADPWFVLPSRITDRNAYAFARLVRATLDPRLRPMFESASASDRAGLPADAVRARHVLDLVSQAFGSDANRVTRILALPSGARVTPDLRTRAVLEQSLAIARADALAVDLATAGTQPATEPMVLQSAANAALAARAAHVACFGFDLMGSGAAAGGIDRWHAAGGGLAVVRYDALYAPSRNVVARSATLPNRATIRPSDTGGGLAIDAGGSAAAPFVADQDYGPGTFTSTTTNAIDTSGVSGPAPQVVYQSVRAGGAFSYTIPGLTPNASYIVRLHFSENYWNQSGKRIFNVGINGAPVLANFDIFAAAGKKFAAVARTLNVVTDPNGQIVIKFARVSDNASIAGIELAPSTLPKTALNDWTTYGYDNARDGFNPNSAALTPASVAQLSEVWQANLLTNTQTQPIVATGVGAHTALVIVGGANGSEYAFDAQSGAQVWKQSLGSQTFNCGSPSTFGVGGTAVYDAASHSVFVPDDRTTSGVVADEIYRLDVGTGAVLAQTNVAPSPLAMGSAPEIDFLHTALTLAPSGLLYAGTGSTCDISPWRGRVAAVDTHSMTLAGTFFTTFGQGANYSGGGVWGWGGVSVDGSGNVYTGVGNADDSATTNPLRSSAERVRRLRRTRRETVVRSLDGTRCELPGLHLRRQLRRPRLLRNARALRAAWLRSDVGVAG